MITGIKRCLLVVGPEPGLPAAVAGVADPLGFSVVHVAEVADAVTALERFPTLTGLVLPSASTTREEIDRCRTVDEALAVVVVTRAKSEQYSELSSDALIRYVPDDDLLGGLRFLVRKRFFSDPITAEVKRASEATMAGFRRTARVTAQRIDGFQVQPSAGEQTDRTSDTPRGRVTSGTIHFASDAVSGCMSVHASNAALLEIRDGLASGPVGANAEAQWDHGDEQTVADGVAGEFVNQLMGAWKPFVLSHTPWLDCSLPRLERGQVPARSHMIGRICLRTALADAGAEVYVDLCWDELSSEFLGTELDADLLDADEPLFF